RRPPHSVSRSLGLSASVAATELFKGGPEPNRVIILEFADRAAVKRWYNSLEYQKILPGRLDNSTGRFRPGRSRHDRSNPFTIPTGVWFTAPRYKIRLDTLQVRNCYQ